MILAGPTVGARAGLGLVTSAICFDFDAVATPTGFQVLGVDHVTREDVVLETSLFSEELGQVVPRGTRDARVGVTVELAIRYFGARFDADAVLFVGVVADQARPVGTALAAVFVGSPAAVADNWAQQR
jgi:hypothetical protein